MGEVCEMQTDSHGELRTDERDHGCVRQDSDESQQVEHSEPGANVLGLCSLRPLKPFAQLPCVSSNLGEIVDKRLRKGAGAVYSKSTRKKMTRMLICRKKGPHLRTRSGAIGNEGENSEI